VLTAEFEIDLDYASYYELEGVYLDIYSQTTNTISVYIINEEGEEMTVLNKNGYDDGVYSYFDNDYTWVSEVSDPDLDNEGSFGPVSGDFGDTVSDLSKKFTIKFVIEEPQYGCFIDEFWFEEYDND